MTLHPDPDPWVLANEEAMIREEIATAERQLDTLRYAQPRSHEHARVIVSQIEAQERHLGRLRELLT